MTHGQALVLAFDAVAFVAIVLSYFLELIEEPGNENSLV